MIKLENLFNIKFYLFFLIILIPNFNSAKEIMIYADSITYDENENIIARGKAKVFHDNNLIISDLIIYNKIFEIKIIKCNQTIQQTLGFIKIVNCIKMQ